MTDSQELVPVEDHPLVAADLLDEAALDRAAKRIEMVDRMKVIAIRSTRKEQWQVMGGKPYPTDTACANIANTLGLAIRNPQAMHKAGGDVMEDERGEYRVFRYQGELWTADRQVTTQIGMANSRDQFLSRGGKLPQSEVDMSSIEKKAYTNMVGRLIRKGLGLDFTMEDLEKAGIRASDLTHVDYGSGNGADRPPTGRVSTNQQKPEPPQTDMREWESAPAPPSSPPAEDVFDRKESPKSSPSGGGAGKEMSARDKLAKAIQIIKPDGTEEEWKGILDSYAGFKNDKDEWIVPKSCESITQKWGWKTLMKIYEERPDIKELIEG